MKVTNTSYFRFRNHNHQSINEKSNNIDLLIVDRSLRIRFHRREDHSFIYHFLGLIFPSNVLHLFAAPKSTFHISVANTRVSTNSTCSHSYKIFFPQLPSLPAFFSPSFCQFFTLRPVVFIHTPTRDYPDIPCSYANAHGHIRAQWRRILILYRVIIPYF